MYITCYSPFLFFFFQGVSLAKVIEAGDFICTALRRETNSKVAQARGKALWCVLAGRWCLNLWLPFKMLPLLLLPSDLLPLMSYLFIWALFIVVKKKFPLSSRRLHLINVVFLWLAATGANQIIIFVKRSGWLICFSCVCLHSTYKARLFIS